MDGVILHPARGFSRLHCWRCWRCVLLTGCHAVDYYDASLQQLPPPHGAAAGTVDGVAAGLSRRAARHPADRNAQAGAAAALPHRHLRRAANPRDGHDARPADRRLLPGRRRGHRHPRAGLRHGPRGRHDHRRGHRGHHATSCSDVLAQAATSRCSWPAPPARSRSPAQYLVGAGRHDQPAAIRHGARGGQDGDRDPPGPAKAPVAVLRLARGRRSTWLPTTARCFT